MRVRAGGGTPERIAAAAAGELLHGPQLLPGGDAVLFTVAAATPTNWDEAQIVVQSLRSGERSTVIKGGSDARLAPGGRIVYAAGGKLFAVPFDMARRQVTGPAVQIVDGVMTAGSATGTTQFALAADGAIAYVPRPFNPLALVARDGTRTPVGQLPATTFAPRLSPDGRRIVYDSDLKVWIADLANLASARPITPADSINNFPMWSADGQRAVFTSNREGGVQGVYWQRADGTDDAELLVRPARAAESWSPDGERVTFLTQSQANSYDVWSYSMRDRKAAPLIAAPKTAQMGSRFSPDGRWLAYESDESSRLEIYVQPFPFTGARYQVTKDGGSRALWSPDGRQLYFDRGQRLFVVDVRTQGGFSTGEPVALPISGFIQGNLRRQYDMTPDGQQFLMMFRGPLLVRVMRLPPPS
jgi:serine/threonine-protein kinase